MTKINLQPEAEEIFERLDHLKLTQRALADELGIEENKISKARKGERQFKASEVLRARAWLLLQEGRAKPDDPDAREIVEIQKLDLSISMGPGTLIDDWIESELVAFDRAFVQMITRTTTDRLKLISGIGDSMFPTLAWGDAILIDTTDRMLSRQDGIYWINLYGAAGIKRLRTVGKGRVLVKSDNPAVDDQEVDAEELRIEGRAIWLARGL